MTTHDGAHAGVREMTPYDSHAWDEVVTWRNSRLAPRTRRIVAPATRDRLARAGQGAKARLKALPGGPEFETVFLRALGGVIDLGARSAMASVRRDAIVAAYRKHGHCVDEIDDIRGLDLKVIDAVKPRLDLLYTAGATAEGAAAGFVVAGGQAAAAAGSVLGVGAGGAPGAGAVIATMAGDAAAVLVSTNRAVAHIAAYYGYDATRPDERLFALAVLSMGTAAEAGKAAAYVEINKLVQALARRAAWKELRENVVARVVEKVFLRLGFRITQRKLGQAVPIVGVVFGAGMNANLLLKVTDDAEHVYRERFLRDRYDLPTTPGVDAPTAEETDADVIDVVGIVEDELDENPAPGSSNAGADENATPFPAETRQD